MTKPSRQLFDKNKFELTGEYRSPKKDEYYVDLALFRYDLKDGLKEAECAKYINLARKDFTMVSCWIVREKTPEEEKLTLKVGPLYLTAGGYVVKFNKIDIFNGRIIANKKFCPGKTSNGCICYRGWKWRLDGTIGGLTEEWTKRLKIVKQLDFDLPDLPEGYRWKDGFPQLKCLNKGDLYLEHDGHKHTSVVGKACSYNISQRFLVEKIESDNQQPEKSEYPRYFTHKTGFHDNTSYIEVWENCSYLVRHDGEKVKSLIWTLDECLNQCHTSWKEIDDPIHNTNISHKDSTMGANFPDKNAVFFHGGKKYKHMDPPVLRKVKKGEVYTMQCLPNYVYTWDGNHKSLYAKYVLEPVEDDQLEKEHLTSETEKGESIMGSTPWSGSKAGYTPNQYETDKTEDVKFPTEAIGSAMKTIGTLLVKKPVVYMASLGWSMTKKSINYWLLEPAKNIITRVMMSVRYITMLTIMGTGVYGGVYAYNNFDDMKKEIMRHVPTIKVEWKDNSVEVDS